jgi:hypothetical protein
VSMTGWFRGKSTPARDLPRPSAFGLVRDAARGNLDAARRVVSLGPESIPALRDLLGHPAPQIRRWTVTALAAMTDRRVDAALPMLSLAFDDEDASVRDEALQGFLRAANRPAWEIRAS